MNKNTHFSGQPIFAQLLKLLDRGKISSIAKEQKSDRYYKKFKTYEHLVTMMFAYPSQVKHVPLWRGIQGEEENM